MQGVTNAPMRVGLAGAAVAVQIAGSPALLERPRLNASHAVASYIAARSPSTAGVLADTVAIEFYSRLPVRAAPFTYPRELVLESLEGTVRDDILFVVIDSAGVHRNLDAYRQQIDALLARNFELVPAGGAALHVYRRRER
jgi:hypothetical protein